MLKNRFHPIMQNSKNNVASEADIDLAMTKGVNYPKGLIAWAKEIGLQECVRRIDALYELYHEDRYRCSVALRKAASASQN
jgi:3-hydroxybutyryl-CoA dehydrogenase